MRTPEGQATLRVLTHPADGLVEAHAWGSGADWALTSLPRMLGDEDDSEGFIPQHDRVALALRRHPGWRVPRTTLVLESLVPAVVEQKVTGQEAFGGWQRIVRRYGDPAPGPGAALGMRVPPSPQQLAAIPSWGWLRAGVSPQRSDTLARVARVAARVEETSTMSLAHARRRLVSIPGVGVQTSAAFAAAVDDAARFKRSRTAGAYFGLVAPAFALYWRPARLDPTKPEPACREICLEQG